MEEELYDNICLAQAKNQKQKYKQRIAENRDPLDRYCNEYEVEPHIFYDPNNVTCYVNTSEL